MNLIYNLDKIMMNNLKEANDYIKEMYHNKDKSKTYFDLCKDMAIAHLSFNINCIASYKKIVEEISSKGLSDKERYTIEIYQDRLGDYNLETMKLKTLIENCK